MLFEQAHGRGADDEKHGHGYHQLDEREPGRTRNARSRFRVSVRLTKMYVSSHGCTKLVWNVTGGLRVLLVSVTRTVIWTAPVMTWPPTVGLAVISQRRSNVSKSGVAAGSPAPGVTTTVPSGFWV